MEPTPPDAEIDPSEVPEDLTRYERRLRSAGFERIAGVDEAGRGALAGPLVAAAVILPVGFDFTGIRDSKLLSAPQRAEAYGRISAEALAIAVCRATPQRIDGYGLHRSNLSLMRRCVRTLEIEPDYVLVDGFPPGRLPVPCLSIKKGDLVCGTVAAASIVAKVVRDRTMIRYHRRWPSFAFDQNKGYGTPEHWAALDRLGPTPIHRLSFNGVGQTSLGLAPPGKPERGDVLDDPTTEPEVPIPVGGARSAATPSAWDDEPR